MALPFLLLLPLVASGLELTPPENIWVRAGQTNVTMLCVASQQIRSCSWSTPYGKVYPLESGLMAEAGRLAHAATGRGECGVTLAVIEPRDEGRWSCNVGVVENSEVTTASGMASVSLALPPASLALVGEFAGAAANLSAHTQYEVECAAAAAKPRPTFTWLLDDAELDGEFETRDTEVMVDADGLSTFSQRLVYTPAQWHANKTLTCTAAHPGLAAALTAATKVLLTGVPVAAAGFPLGGLVAIVVVVVVIILACLVGLVVKMRLSKAPVEKTDAEKAESADGEADKNSKTESAHEDTTEEEVKKTNFQTKITAFFTALKTKEPKKVDDTVATEWEKVDLVDEGEVKVVEEKEGLGSKVTALLAKLKPEKKEKEAEKKEEKKEEEKVEETEEKKDAEKPIVRRGSETPV